MEKTIDKDARIFEMAKQIEQLKDMIGMFRSHAGILNMQIQALDEMNVEMSKILVKNNLITEQELDDMYEEIWKDLSEGSE